MRLNTFLVMMMICSNSIAGGSSPSSQTGQILHIEVIADGRMTVHMKQSRGDRPECAIYEYWIIKDENSAAGKAQLSILLAAQISARSVTIHGYGTCDRVHDGEDIKQVVLRND